MVQYLIYAMVYLGAALMVYNIYGFIRFARFIKGRRMLNSSAILYIPILLLIFFLIGYLVIGIIGKPDLIMAGVLFGGSIFVQIMYRLLSIIVRRVIESEQQKAELQAAKESSRAKESFLASISHEMRTPMNVILGMDELALKDPSLSPDTRSHLEKIGQSARHLSGLINNILDLQEAEDGRKGIQEDSISLRDVVEQIDAALAESCSAKGLSWKTSIEEAAIRGYTGDAGSLKRALMAVLDNAVKFTDAPGSVSMVVHGIAPGGLLSEIHFIISDTGIGMSAEFLPRVFEPFAREDESSTNRFGGSGLGLAVAYRIIQGLGGTIEAASMKHEGSTFTVIIPLAYASLAANKKNGKESTHGDQQTDAGPGGQEGSPALLKGCRFLIVDDVKENAEIVGDLLELEGAVSDHALNGRIGLEMFEHSAEGTYDAILMDLRMPVMDGLEATRKIRGLDRADAKTIPIIAISANAYESDVQNSLKAGMNSHLAKPADSDQLYAEIGRWVRKTGEEDAVQQ